MTSKPKLRSDKSYDDSFIDENGDFRHLIISSGSESESEYEPTPEKKPVDNVIIAGLEREYLHKAWVFWRSAKKERRTLAQVHNRYSRVTSVRQLERYEALVSTETDLQNALTRIGDSCHARFMENWNNGKITRGRIIRNWALQLKQELFPDINFQASKKWLSKWQKDYCVSVRAISGWVTKKSVEDTDKRFASVDQFIRHVNRKIRDNHLDYAQVYNIDQSAIDRENHQQITLAPKGVKKVEMQCQSQAALTHLATIMPIISAAGKLMPVMFVQLAEGSGGLPKTKPIFRPGNLYIVGKKSHMMDGKTMEEFFQKVYFQTGMQKESLVLCDS